MFVHRCLHITATLLLCQMLFEAGQSQECTSVYSIRGMKLQRHVYKKIPASLGSKCLQECDHDFRCQSLNYVMSREICELNNRTKEACPEDFVPDSYRYYYGRVKNRVPLGSIPELPAESCKEIERSEGKQAVAGQYWLSTTQHRMPVFVYCYMGTECHNYTRLNNADRKVTYKQAPVKKCDLNIGPGWFRFEGAAGTRMRTSCTPDRRCSTDMTGWMNGVHPKVADGAVDRQVCFSGYHKCCFRSTDIQVKNCGSYFVYYFSGTPSCNFRYCGTD